MGMVMSVLEASVPKDRWKDLQSAYERIAQQLTPGIVQTFLLHDTKDPALWRIATVWENREAIEAMRQSGETPGGVLVFRAAGAEPTLSIFDVVVHRTGTH